MSGQRDQQVNHSDARVSDGNAKSVIVSDSNYSSVTARSPHMQAARQRRRSSLQASNGDQSNGTGPTAVATATTVADQLGSSGKPTVKKNWLRHRLFNTSKGSLKNLEDDESDVTSRASSAADLQVTHTYSDLQCKVTLYSQPSALSAPCPHTAW